MFAPRISVILFSVVLVGVSIFTIQLLFAGGENGGDVCHPGEIVPYTSDTPQPNPPGPPWTRVEEEGTAHTNGGCEYDATCVPLDCECQTYNAGPSISVNTKTTTYLYSPLDGYLPASTSALSGDDYGYYTGCSDSLSNTW
jgi:hypothetical protein